MVNTSMKALANNVPMICKKHMAEPKQSTIIVTSNSHLNLGKTFSVIEKNVTLSDGNSKLNLHITCRDNQVSKAANSNINTPRMRPVLAHANVIDNIPEPIIDFAITVYPEKTVPCFVDWSTCFWILISEEFDMRQN